jgi:hypothetical protein
VAWHGMAWPAWPDSFFMDEMDWGGLDWTGLDWADSLELELEKEGREGGGSAFCIFCFAFRLVVHFHTFCFFYNLFLLTLQHSPPFWFCVDTSLCMGSFLGCYLYTTHYLLYHIFGGSWSCGLGRGSTTHARYIIYIPCGCRLVMGMAMGKAYLGMGGAWAACYLAFGLAWSGLVWCSRVWSGLVSVGCLAWMGG